MGEKHAAPIGRPRGFDRDGALQTALHLFWRHGYEGVSIADLTQAMGIAPPSLYAAFGNKAALYREVLEVYRKRPGSQALRDLQQDGPVRERVGAMLRHCVRAATDPATPAGCMVTTGLLYCGADHADLAGTVTRMRAERCATITDRLQRAAAESDLPPGTDVPALARYLVAVMQGICIQARDGATAADLDAVVDMALGRWPG